MAISTSTEANGAVVVSVTGDLDLSTAGELRDGGLAALGSDDCRHLIVDLSQVDFLDSTGLGVLAELRNAGQAAGRTMSLRDPQAQAQRVLALTALDAVFTVERSPAG